MSGGLGCIPDPADDRDHLWRAAVPRGAVVVPAAYMVEDDAPILDQGQTSMCVAFSGAAIRTTQEVIDDGTVRAFDAPDLYTRCKAVDGYPNANGTIIRVSLDIAKNEGVTMAEEPFHRYHIREYTRLESIQQIKESLATDGPVQFGITLDESFYAVGADGVLPALTGKKAGGHAMAIYGYDDSVGAFRVRNSWGASWGDGGYCWLPYSYFDAHPGWDAWRLADLPNAASEPSATDVSHCASCGQPLLEGE